MTREIFEVGDVVECDFCSEDWTDRDESGGFLFGGYAVCPDCAKKRMPEILKHGEVSHIKAYCPPDLSFADWVRRLRYATGNDKVIITTD